MDTAGLARALGIPVVPVSAALGEGSTRCWTRPRRQRTARRPTCGARWRQGPVQTCVRTLARLPLPLAARTAGLPPGVRGDVQWFLDDGGTLRAPAAAEQAAEAHGAREGYSFRDEALPRRALRRWTGWRGFTLPQALPGSRLQVRIDRVLTGRYTAYPRWQGLLGSVFYLTFHVIGRCLSRLLSRAASRLAAPDAADSTHGAGRQGPLLHGLVRGSVFAGVRERGGGVSPHR